MHLPVDVQALGCDFLVCSPYKFTHAADAMARIVLQNALFVDPDAKLFGGKTGPAVRIRAKRLPQAAGSTNAAKATATPPPDEIVEPGASQDDSGNAGSEGGS